MDIFHTPQVSNLGPTACAIGMFDGVHLGHRLVLEQAIRTSKIQHLKSVVFTFANHPQSVISQTPTPLLSTLEERLEAFKAMGYDAALVLPFTPELQHMPREIFVQTILMDCLKTRFVSVGYDHRFGQGRHGDGVFLTRQGKQYGFEVAIIDPVRVNQQIVSSTLIRKLLSFGDLETANILLGRPYELTGSVVEGVGRGKTLGFPTANLAVDAHRLMPANGVYAGNVCWEDQVYPAVCNIGIAPTFSDQPVPRLEIHLLDGQHQLYGKTLTFQFLHHLRDELRFPSVDALISQIQHDCHQARTLLSHTQDHA